MLVVKKSVWVWVVLSSICVYWFILNTDRNLKAINVSLRELEETRSGLYNISARIVDIEEDNFSINDGETNIKIRGRLQDKNIITLVTQSKKLFAEIKVKKSGGMYTLVSIKRADDQLYVESPEKIKGNVIINSKGILGKF